MEDCSPGPLPISTADLTQICITPLVAAPARLFKISTSEVPFSSTDAASHSAASAAVPPSSPTSDRSSLELSSLVPTQTSPAASLSHSPSQPPSTASVASSSRPASTQMTSITLTTSAGSFSRCVRGRLPRRDHVFADAVFGPRFGLVMSTSGAEIESLAVVTAEGGTAVIGAGSETPEHAPRPLASEMRWGQLARFQKELASSLVAGGAGWAVGAVGHVGMNGLMAVRETVPMRHYLSCPEPERIWAFRAVMEILIDPLDPEHGHHDLNGAVARLDRISHRVEILCQVDVPGTKRRERLRSYFAEGSRAWLALRGGDLALRVSGYVGAMRNDEDVYEHLTRVLLPAFT
ncbi:hypothetical protein HK405_004144 [Cladochytrium tenue]|nr:hypothetical protein HK405_004144 [Cladochytrium tenue]